MYNCKTCLGAVFPSELVKCLSCRNTYHHNCVNITSAYYMANSNTLKMEFKCPTCRQETIRDPETTIHNNSDILPNTPLSTSLANITHRKPRQILDNTEGNESLLALSLSSQSLPTITENNEELREENDNLRLQLDAANSEIDNLILENTRLNKSLEEHKKRIEFLKSVGITGGGSPPPMFFSPQYRRIHPSSMRMGYPRMSPGQFTNGVIKQMASVNPDADSAGDVKPAKSSQPVETAAVTSQPEVTCQPPRASTEKQGYQKRKILLLADERGIGMNKILKNILGSLYSVESFIKPQATMNQVMTSCTNLCKEYTNKDFVIVLAGSNDRDPLNLQSMLYYELSQSRHTNVILLNVDSGKFLNERKLNSTLKFLCSRFDHTTFVNTGKMSSKLYVCRNVYQEILRLNYRINYDEYKNSVVHSVCNKDTAFSNVETQTDDDDVQCFANGVSTKSTNPNQDFR